MLIVDDEEVSRYLVRQLLPRGAFELSEAATGVDGLRRVRDERPDVVLLDLKMAGMDGFTFLDRLSEDEGTREVPAVILTSASCTPEERRRLRRSKAIVAKSDLSADTLVAAIKGAVETHAARGP